MEKSKKTEASPAKIGCSIMAAVVIGFIVLTAIVATNSVPPSSSKKVSETKVEQQSESNDTDNTATSGNWKYFTETFGIENKTARVAFINSKNSLELGFPYSGENNGHIVITKRQGASPDVSFRMDKGQFMTRFDGTTIKVKFDDLPVKRFSCSEGSDHTTGILFLNNAKLFISMIKGTSKN